MITIPTKELTAGLTEALAFAAPDKDAYWHGVLITWDGERLHFSATDTLSSARVTWIPGEGVESRINDKQEVTLPHFGGDDAPWKVFITLPSAKEVIKTFGLAAKLDLVPVTIKVTPTGSSLIVERSRETGQSQHLGMWPSDLDRAAKFPDIEETALIANDLTPLNRVEFSAYRLAAFGSAARHGTLSLEFTGHGQVVIGRAGNGFLGLIYPAGVTSAQATERSNFLRHGSGVHVSAPDSDE